MKPYVSETYMPRSEVVEQLSRVRYPDKTGVISKATMSRWRNLARIHATRFFTAEEYGRLHRIAEFSRLGLTYREIQKRLGLTNDDQFQPQDRTKASEQRQDFSAAGSAPIGLEFLYRD